jgi:hypothetical protein
MTNFHRLATIVEALNVGIKDLSMLEDNITYTNDNEKENINSKSTDNENGSNIIIESKKRTNSTNSKNLSVNTSIIKDEERAKNLIIEELELINKEESKSTQASKLNGDDIINKLNTSFDKENDPETFNIHISSYCTKYLDFDSHSQEFSSYLVK